MKAELISLNYHVPACDTTLRDFPVIIGRGRGADIRLEDRSVCDYHCRIDLLDGELTVTDLGSLHGTCVNSSQITESPLRHGDELAIGMLSFLVQYDRTAKSNVPRHDDERREADALAASAS